MALTDITEYDTHRIWITNRMSVVKIISTASIEAIK